MRKLIVSENVTLDGVMEAPDLSYQSDDMAEVVQGQMRAADALLLGRVTYQEFAAFWPFQKDDAAGVADYINNVAKFVVSSTLDKADWHNTTILSGDAVAEIAKLKQQSGQDIVVTGSGALVHSLMPHHLIDEYRLFFNPIVVGHGKRLFPDGINQRLQQIETQTFSSGAIMIRYQPTHDQ
ncbi:MAG: dihydrofolate reductase family protein [Roseiflexaceae bacterium]